MLVFRRWFSVLSPVLLICAISGKQCLKLRKTQISSHCPPKQGSHPPTPPAPESFLYMLSDRTIIHTRLVLGTKRYYFLKLTVRRDFSGLYSGKGKIKKENPTGWTWGVLSLSEIPHKLNEALVVDVLEQWYNSQAELPSRSFLNLNVQHSPTTVPKTTR